MRESLFGMTTREAVVAETAAVDALSCRQRVVPIETHGKSVVAETATVDAFSCGQSVVPIEASVQLLSTQYVSQ